MESYDTVILGAGLDGLACGVWLARAGRRVALIDERRQPGGLAEPLEPGTLDLALGPDCVALPRSALMALGLEDGDALTEVPVRRYVPLAEALDGGLPEGLPPFRPLVPSNLPAEGVNAEATALAAFAADLSRALALFEAEALNPPPAPLAKRDGLRSLASDGPDGVVPPGWHDRALRLALAPLDRVLVEAGLSGPLAASIAQGALEGTGLDPSAPASAFALLLADPLGLSAERVTVDSVSLARALARAFEAAGGELRLGVDVGDIELRDDKVARVSLASQEPLQTKTVVSCFDVKQTLTTLIEKTALPKTLFHRVGRIETRYTTAKLVLMLNSWPESLELWRAPSAWGRFMLSASVDEVERAAAAAKRGLVPDPLPVGFHLPPARRDGAAGAAVEAVLPYVPQRPFGGEWTEEARETLTLTAIGRLDRVFPNFHQSVASTRLLLPEDYQTILGLSGGSWCGATPLPHQFWAHRPLPELAQYRTPVRGLYLGGPDMPPGGFACAAGLNAAEAVLADRNG